MADHLISTIRVLIREIDDIVSKKERFGIRRYTDDNWYFTVRTKQESIAPDNRLLVLLERQSPPRLRKKNGTLLSAEYISANSATIITSLEAIKADLMDDIKKEIGRIKRSCLDIARQIDKRACECWRSSKEECRTISVPTNPVTVSYYYDSTGGCCTNFIINGHLLDTDRLDYVSMGALERHLVSLLSDVNVDYNTIIQKALK